MDSEVSGVGARHALPQHESCDLRRDAHQGLSIVVAACAPLIPSFPFSHAPRVDTAVRGENGMQNVASTEAPLPVYVGEGQDAVRGEGKTGGFVLKINCAQALQRVGHPSRGAA